MGLCQGKEPTLNTVIPIAEVPEEPVRVPTARKEVPVSEDIGVIHFYDGVTNNEIKYTSDGGAIPNQASEMAVTKQNPQNQAEIEKMNAVIDGTEQENSVSELDTFQTAPRQGPELTALIRKSMMGHPIFSNMDEEQIFRIIDNMSSIEVNENTLCSQQGKPGKSFYSVESGLLLMESVNGSNKIFAKLGPGYSFGEIFLYDTPRLYTVKSITKCKLWTIHKSTFRKTIEIYEKAKINERLMLLKKQSIFSNMTYHELCRLADACKQTSVNEGVYLYSNECPIDDYSCFYIVIQGKVIIESAESCKKVEEGSFFGELALITNSPRDHSARTLSPSTFLTLDRKTFLTLHDSLQSILNLSPEAFGLKVVNEIPLFSVLSEEKQHHVFSNGRIKKYEARALIANTIVMGLYIILEGEVIRELNKDSNIMKIEFTTPVDLTMLGGGLRLSEQGTGKGDIHELLVKGDYFGGSILFSKKKLQIKYYANTDVTLLLIPKDFIMAMVASYPEMKRTVVKGYNPKKTIADLATSFQEKTQLDMKSYTYLSFLGRGSFGTCFLAQDKDGHNVTVKCIERQILYKSENVFNDDIVMSVIQEKAILSLIPPSPFLERFFGTSADSKHLYFVLENISGGELEDQIHSKERPSGLPVDSARFYAANIVLMVKHLQDENIVYRDLKPENILLDGETGYLKLIDFGFAKQLFQRTWTLCGTPYYIAPEILACTGHDLAADWWSLGIIIYEMITRKPAFSGNDQLQTFSLILNGELKFTEQFTGELTDLVRGLLMRSKTLRLGSRQNRAKDVMNHRWFSDTNWEDIASGSVTAPVPSRSLPSSRKEKPSFPVYDGDRDWIKNTPLENFCTPFTLH